MSNCREDTACGTAGGLHAATYDSDKCKVCFKLERRIKKGENDYTNWEEVSTTIVEGFSEDNATQTASFTTDKNGNSITSWDTYDEEGYAYEYELMTLEEQCAAAKARGNTPINKYSEDEPYVEEDEEKKADEAEQKTGDAGQEDGEQQQEDEAEGQADEAGQDAEDADQDAEDGDNQQAEDGGGGEESPNEQGE